MATQTQSTSLHSSTVRRDTSTQDQPSPALSISSSARSNALSKRRTKKVIFTGSSEFMERAGRLGTAERRILKDYAGDTTKSRTLVLEKMESYRRQNNDQPPIVELESQASPDGSTKSWKCRICRESKMFPTFQRVALHVTSTHWHLPSWPCPVKSCTRSYQALDQLRRHMKAHPRELTLTGSPISPASAPSPGPRPIAADESQVQPPPFIEPPDGNTQATTSGSRHGWSGFISTNNQCLPFEQPPREFLPQLQPQVSVFDLPPRPLPFPVTNEFEFPSNFLPNSDHANLPSTSVSMNAFPLNVNNAGQQVRFTGCMEHGQINASGFPMNQDFSQSNTYHDDLATHCYDDLTFRQAGRNFSSVANTSGIFAHQSHSRMSQGGVDALRYLDHPAFSQPGSGASFASNNFDRSMSYSAPLTYSRNYTTPENEIRRQMSREYPFFGRLGRQDFIDLSEELAPDTFCGSDQAPWGS